MNIIKLNPVYKDYLWGGNRLKSLFNKNFDGEIAAESWELSCHKDGESVIGGGEYDGVTFSHYLKEINPNALGKNNREGDMPILIKFIDSRQALSIQVHPNDDYAKAYSDNGKTEMWYIVAAEPNAYLYYGFKHNITKEEFSRRIEDGTLTEVLQKVPVQKGESYFIKAGTIHAIGAGIVIAEIQQSSNLTYRVFDYDRIDANGNKRPLHIEQALDVTELSPAKNFLRQGDVIAQCEYFTVKEHTLSGQNNHCIDECSFLAIVFISGCGHIGNRAFNSGDTFFVDASKTGVEEMTIEGEGVYLSVTTYTNPE